MTYDGGEIKQSKNVHHGMVWSLDTWREREDDKERRMWNVLELTLRKLFMNWCKGEVPFPITIKAFDGEMVINNDDDWVEALMKWD